MTTNKATVNPFPIHESVGGYMYPFITDTSNLIVGSCVWDADLEDGGACIYCYAQGKRGIKHNRPNLKKLYSGEPRINPNVFKKRLKSGAFLFPSMRDWYNPNVPEGLRSKAFSWIEECNKAATARNGKPITVLIQTKNPKGAYGDLARHLIPENCIVGATIEADINYPTLSGAPPQTERLEYMIAIKADFPEVRTFVSIEPVLVSTDDFAEKLKPIRPWAFAVGYDNHFAMLPEPALADTEKLIADLSWFAQVYKKKIRRAWYE